MLDRYILPLLKDDRYYEAFSIYLEKAEEFLPMARDGAAFDIDNDPGKTPDLFILLGMVVVIPIAAAWYLTDRWKKQMRTAVKATQACEYIPAGGVRLTAQDDRFLYRTESRRKIETSSSSSKGGTTTDSSGTSGRSGKY